MQTLSLHMLLQIAYKFFGLRENNMVNIVRLMNGLNKHNLAQILDLSSHMSTISFSFALPIQSN